MARRRKQADAQEIAAATGAALLEQKMADEAARIAALDAADAAERAAHAGDLAWVTAERDALLASVGIVARMFVETCSGRQDAASVAYAAATMRRDIIIAGNEATGRKGGNRG